MFYNKTVPEWADVLDTSDYPHDYMIIFAAFATNVLFIALSTELAQPIVTFLVNKIVPGDPAAFIIDHYMPELKSAVSGLEVKLEDKYLLMIKMVGVVGKIVFAFCFQEHYMSFPIF